MPEQPTSCKAKVPTEHWLSVQFDTIKPFLSRASCYPSQKASTCQSTAAAKPLRVSRMPGSPSDSRHFSWMPLITLSMVSPKASRAAAMISTRSVLSLRSKLSSQQSTNQSKAGARGLRKAGCEGLWQARRLCACTACFPQAAHGELSLSGWHFRCWGQKPEPQLHQLKTGCRILCMAP